MVLGNSYLRLITFLVYRDVLLRWIKLPNKKIRYISREYFYHDKLIIFLTALGEMLCHDNHDVSFIDRLMRSMIHVFCFCHSNLVALVTR